MATVAVDKAEDDSAVKENANKWKFPKISIDQIYKKKTFRFFPSYVIKDYERTITLDSSNSNVTDCLVSYDFVKGFAKKQNKFLHLGLVQIAIKPLIRAGLGGPVTVCVRDSRQPDFRNSLLAIVEANLSEGSFYFNCFPSFSVSIEDESPAEDDEIPYKFLTLNIKTEGTPLALAYRLVCKAMVDLNAESLKEVILGETSYFHAASGTTKATKWDEVLLPESWTSKN